MSLVFLIPGLLSLYWVLKGRVETALLGVYLPALLLLPQGYAMRFPHIPWISSAEAALLPIAVVAFGRFFRQGLPSLMDLLVAGYVISATCSEVLREQVTKDGIFVAIGLFMSIFCPYLVGKTIIESSGIRLEAVRRIVWCMVSLAPIGLLEWRFSQNLYGVFAERLLHVHTVQNWIQLRGGHGRMAASFSDAEIAGIGLGMAMMLAAWLYFLRKWGALPQPRTLLEKAERWHLPEVILFGCILLTQSRGPWLAVLVGYIVAQVPRFRKTRFAAVVAVVLVMALVGAAIAYFRHYTQTPDPNDERVGSAIYRRIMNQVYQPVVRAGGLLGWGVLSRPVLPGMFSIDNEYLLVHISYGHLGYWLLVLVAIESERKLVLLGWRGGPRADVAFMYVMQGALLALWLAIWTVYLGEQLPQFAFLLAGWGQSIGKAPASEENLMVAPSPRRFAFARVFQ